MGKPRNLGTQIKNLHSQGFNYTQIISTLNCSKGTAAKGTHHLFNSSIPPN